MAIARRHQRERESGFPSVIYLAQGWRPLNAPACLNRNFDISTAGVTVKIAGDTAPPTSSGDLSVVRTSGPGANGHENDSSATTQASPQPIIDHGRTPETSSAPELPEEEEPWPFPPRPSWAVARQVSPATLGRRDRLPPGMILNRQLQRVACGYHSMPAPQQFLSVETGCGATTPEPPSTAALSNLFRANFR